jgi:hypothetical protein
MKTALFSLIILSSSVFAKGVERDTFLLSKEREIAGMLTELRKAPSDDTRYMLNEDLREELKSLLTHPGVMTHPFESWTTMSTITSPDGAFRIFNWNVEDDFGMHSHYCYIVKPDGKENTVIELKEDKITISPRPEHTLTADHWYGALYYSIIPVKKGGKTLYTVLGFSGNDRATNRKLLDVFYFKGKTIRIGYPLFQESENSDRLVRRVFLEYSDKAIISLRMNENLGAIVFDHLTPERPDLEGLYDFYIPDMTYDGYKWVDGIWEFHPDFIAWNEENRKIKQYDPSADSTDIGYREINDIWIDPVTPGALGGGSDATAPVENVKEKKTETRNGKGKHRKFFFFKGKGPRSAVTGESTRRKRVRN